MRQGKIHIAAEAEKPNWSKELILIPIPIRKVTMGFRLFLVHQDHQQEIAQTQSLEALKAWPTGSGYQWSIRKVLEENQFNVVTSKSYEGLFDMLNAKRFVTFSRGINEIFSEYEQFKKDIPNVALDQHIAIHIPLPNYFFISPKHKALAERVEKGLKMLIDNGEFEEIFMAHHKDIIEKAKLAERKIFYLDNKNLSKQSLKAIKNEKYWLKP